MQKSKEPSSPSTMQPVELEKKDYSEYLVYSRAEILFILRAIIQRGALLTVYFDSGNQFFLTSLLTLSEDGSWLYLDPASDEAINQRALKAHKLVFTTTLDKVKIQFSVGGLQSAPFKGRPVFAGRLPETLLRLQRREYYRLTTPIATPMLCHFSLAAGQDTRRFQAPILDISGGGVGLSLPADTETLFDTGALIDRARIELPDEGPLETDLCVRNAFPVSGKSGHPHVRVGCEYVDLPGSKLSMIQRYITRVERERKARAAGLE